jgi:hypothetical protein
MRVRVGMRTSRNGDQPAWTPCRAEVPEIPVRILNAKDAKGAKKDKNKEF